MNQIADYIKIVTARSAMIAAVVAGLVFTSSLDAQQKPAVKDALKFVPKQKSGVLYDTPTAKEIENCRIESAQKQFGKSGWVVYGPAGRVLRKFIDTGGKQGRPDKNLDQWSYYKDGIEVYRDIDSNFDGNTDQYRWFGPDGGTRWGIDNDQDGNIDSWKQISAAEVVEELFYAIRQGGVAGDKSFRRLLLSGKELTQMQLGDEFQKKVAEKIRISSAKFKSFSTSQRNISANTKWSQFSSARPNVVPAGTKGLKRDILIYNLASGLYTNGRKMGQLSVGTLIEVAPNRWKLIELPEFIVEDTVVANGNIFYPTPEINLARDGGPVPPADTKLAKLFETFDRAEAQLAKAQTDADKNRYEKQRAQVMLELAVESDKQAERINWTRNMTDTVCNAFTTEVFPDGLKFLESTVPKLEKANLKEAIPYLEKGVLNARFSLAHSTGSRKEKARASERYNDDLERFAKRHPRSPLAAEALLQLGLTADLSGDDPDVAIQWYKRCRDAFPNSIQGKRATGALARIEGIGRPFQMKAQQINGRPFDLQSRNLRGKVIVIHFWETWCDQCIDGFEELQRLNSKYNTSTDQKLLVIGANLDKDVQKVKAFLAKNRNVNWPQLQSPGGVDKSPLAVNMGIATLPLSILIDQQGNLVEGNIHVDELEREIQRLLKKRNANRNASPRR